MPQRYVDSGRIVPFRIYQTITATGDTAEGPVTLPEAKTNVLEIVAQSWRQVFIESRNDDPTNTITQTIYGTRKFMESVPAQGDAFWDVTADHWELLDTQSNIAVSTNGTPYLATDKGFTYLVVAADGQDGAQASGTVTLASVLAGDTVTVNGLVYTAVAGAKADNTEFSIDGTDIADAADLADSITNDARTGITEATLDQTAANGGTAVVTITCTTSTADGNNIDLSSSNGTRLATSGANLTGGLDTSSQFIARAVLTA